MQISIKTKTITAMKKNNNSKNMTAKVHKYTKTRWLWQTGNN